jgi:hypothetical protein
LVNTSNGEIVTNKDNSSGSRLRLRKAAAIELLQKRDLDQLREWGRADSQSLRVLASLLFETDPLIRWRTIEALGYVGADTVKSNPDAVHRLLQRLLWLMNDESGGLCWHAPEAIAEILNRAPRLMPEFGEILLSFLNEEPFEVGVRLGVARLASSYSEQKERIRAVLELSLKHSDGRISLASMFALKALALPFESPGNDTEPLTAYDFVKGEVLDLTTAQIKELSLEMIGYGQP